MQKKVIKIICDSGANIKAALMKLEDVYLSCSAHKLNLAVRDALVEKKFKIKSDSNGNTQYYVKDFDDDGLLKQTEISQDEMENIEAMNSYKKEMNDVVSKTKKLVGAFKHSENLTRNLREKQDMLYYTSQVKLVQDVATRWNSTFLMLESVLINKEALLSTRFRR